MSKKRFSVAGLLSILMVILGNFLQALSVKLFVLPANLMSCGTTGIGLVVNELTGIPLTVFIFLFNVIMLAIGWIVLGKRFAMTTILSSILFPSILEGLNQVMGEVSITDNMVLNVLFAGIGLAISLGLVMRAGASTGGMDIPPLMLKKFFRIPVSTSLAAFDFCILLLQLLFHTMEDLLYGISLILVISMVLKKVMLFGTSRTEVKIVSEKSQEIRDAILSQVDRGVTMLHGQGGYMRQETDVILSVVSNHELPKIEKLARSIDPSCFMIVSQVSEVWGRGFSYGKRNSIPQD